MSCTFDSANHNSFRFFQALCEQISKESGRLAKSKLISNFLTKYSGDLIVLCRLLLPKIQPRVYNVKDRQIFKLFGRVIGVDLDELERDFEETKNVAGDVSAVLEKFFKKSNKFSNKTSSFSLDDVDSVLNDLANSSREEVQTAIFRGICKRATPQDLKYFVRLIKNDLLMDAGSQVVLEGFHPNAYKAFKVNADLSTILKQVRTAEGVKLGGAALMTPIKPMLAAACKSFKDALQKSPSKLIFGELKYDGERIQIHWDGTNFLFFSRSLKPVMPHKVELIKDFLPGACPNAKNLILDAEILLIDNKSGNPLPFGTLGVHKKTKFSNANVCLFVFDIMYLNGSSLLDKPLYERRKLLREQIVFVPNKLMISEMTEISTANELEVLMRSVIKKGQEGLVLKDSESIYKPGSRHWMKMKRDYLGEGEMADSADMVVVGAYYGKTPTTGGLLSTFLMAVLDEEDNRFKTVCKVHGGLDDATIAELTKSLVGEKISNRSDLVPGWLLVGNSRIPDFVVKNPKKSPIFEITGAEFSKSSSHTATTEDGDRISIRFPRVTKIRSDKTWKNATTLQELRVLIKVSKQGNFVNCDESKSSLKTSEITSSGSSLSKQSKLNAGTISNKRRVPSSPSQSVENSSKLINIRDKMEEQQFSSSPERSEPKRKKKKRPCKFGADCYRKNPVHFNEYSHPSLESDDELEGKYVIHSDESDDFEIKESLDEFDGTRFKIADLNSAQKAQKLRENLVQEADSAEKLAISKANNEYDSEVMKANELFRIAQEMLDTSLSVAKKTLIKKTKDANIARKISKTDSELESENFNSKDANKKKRAKKRKRQKNDEEYDSNDSAGSLKDFIVDEDDSDF